MTTYSTEASRAIPRPALPVGNESRLDTVTPAGWPTALAPRRLAAIDLPTPYMAISLDTVLSRAEELSTALPGVELCYAVKCNPDPQVLRTLADNGVSFEIASAFELNLALAAGADPARISYSNPVKPSTHIATTAAAGVRLFVADGPGELLKLAEHAPGSSVLIRVAVDDRASEFPLSAKFGAPRSALLPLLRRAHTLGLHAAGVTFHVGSQCLSAHAWAQALDSLQPVLSEAHDEDLGMDILDIGGGFPARYDAPVASLADLAAPTAEALDRLAQAGLKPARVLAEPGRALVAEAAVLVTTVLGRETRADGEWLFVDCGAYNGLMEAAQTSGRWPFPMRLMPQGGADRRSSPLKTFTVTGPSCDSTDTLRHAVDLPMHVTVGDRICVGSAGAYSLAHAAPFNGFPVPTTVHL